MIFLYKEDFDKIKMLLILAAMALSENKILRKLITEILEVIGNQNAVTNTKK